MTSHELARLLLTMPDLPVATHAHGHTYLSDDQAASHGRIAIGVYRGKHIGIGDFGSHELQPDFYREPRGSL